LAEPDCDVEVRLVIFFLVWMVPLTVLVVVWKLTSLPWYALGLMLLCWIAGLVAGVFDSDRPGPL
jgi:hypothetical protein